MSSSDAPQQFASSAEISEDLVAELHEFARRLAQDAGDLVRAKRPRVVEVAATKSSAVDVVTEMDREIEAYLRERISRFRPDDGILGEEDGVAEGNSGLTWVVDPIDGTVNYLYGVPAYAVSIAVVAGDGDPASSTGIAGAVHNIPLDETWHAGLGRGAFCGDEPLHVSDVTDPEQLLVGTGFAYDSARRARQGKLLAHLMGQVRDVRRIGSAALDLCSVAGRRLDAYFEVGLNAWDLAGGQIIVEEAGGVVTGLHGAPAGERMTIAGGPAAVEWLSAELLQAGAEDVF